MIVILEGPEGAGKTALAQRLVEQQGFIRYRALSSGTRLPLHAVASWREQGVPVNTFVDDVYVVDILHALFDGGRDATRVLLDRSMISGCLYRIDGGVRDQSELDAALSYQGELNPTLLIGWWASKMMAMGARLIWLDAEPQALASRLAPFDTRGTAEYLRTVRAGFERLMPLRQDLPALAIDTTDLTEDAVYQRATNWLWS